MNGIATLWDKALTKVKGSKLLSAGAWSLGGSVAGQVVRFGANLLLTRLLAPEAFGTAAIVTSVVVGAEMVSDVGLAPAVISSNRADDPTFLRTAWTLKAVRGLGLTVILMAIAYPMSLWFNEPTLTGLLIVSAISAGIRGTNHICEYTLWRHLEQRTLSILWFFTATCGTLTAIALAFWLRSAWALILGNVVTEVIQVICTHYIGRKLPMRFQWEKETIAGLRKFGRWIFASSLLSYLVGQGDRLLLGSLLTLEQLGRYSLASNLGGLIPNFVSPLYGSILLPLYTQHTPETTNELLPRLRRSRAVILLMLLPPLCVMAVFGDAIVRLMWDDRYHDAGWMVQLFSAGQILAALGNIGPIYLARGETWISMVLEAGKAIVLLGGVALGYMLAGVTGVIIAVALSVGIAYPLWVWINVRYRVWLPRLDAVAIVGCVVISGALLLFKRWWLGAF